MPRGKNLRPEAADGHRFGDPGGADPRKATKMGPPKWSIRKALAHMAAQEVDPRDKNAMVKLLGSNPTVAQVIAASALTKASRGDMTAINYATDNIDGRLPQISEMTGKDGKAIEIATRPNLSQLTDDELRQAESLALKLAGNAAGIKGDSAGEGA